MFRTTTFALLFLSSSHVALAADIDGPFAGSEYAPVVEVASGGIAGYVEGSYTKAVDAPNDVDADAWALRGAINIDAGAGMNLQLDLGYARASIEGGDADKYDGALHAYYRDDLYAAGVFLGASRFDVGLSDDIKDYTGGIEGAFFQDTWSLVGAVGYGQAEWAGFDADHYMGALGARWYATDNMRFDVDGTLDRITEAGTDLDIRSLKLTANYRPDQMPVTLFAGYKYTDLELTSAVSGDVSTIFGGLRFSYGSNSIKEEERLGPTWSNRSLSF